MTYAYGAETPQAEQTTESIQNPGLLASLGINGTQFVSQLINFALVALILWYLILKPLTKKMSERQKLIDDSLANAKKIQENLEQSERKFQQRIDEAKVEANKILERTNTEAEQLSVQLKEKAKHEIEILVDQAKRNINIERDDMVASLKSETASLIVLAMEKILHEKVTSEKDKKMIEEMLKTVKS